MSEEHIGRWLFEGDHLVQGYLRADDGVLEEICREPPPPDSTRSLIIPAFVNAHTHIGDAFAYPAPRGTVEDVVGPGGYKHRTLSSVSFDEKVAGMRSALELMTRTGTAAFVDFREEGVEGIAAMRDAIAGQSVRGIVLGRPRGRDVTEEELARVLDNCDGLAFSAVSDWSIDILAAAADFCRQADKRFSIHASETRREPIDAVLDLEPDFVVHMTAATDDDIIRCAEAHVPIVVCPRSNSFFGMAPDIPRLLRLGADVALGTDNAMISQPNMIDEMRAAYASANRSGRLSPADAVRLATLSGRKVLNAEGQITTEMSVSDDLIAVDVEGEDPLLELVSSAATAAVSVAVHQEKMRRLSFG